MPPKEQERFMAHNPEFQSFGPRRQELIRERLRRWNAMTPEQKERVRQREGCGFAWAVAVWPRCRSGSSNEEQSARMQFI